MAKKIPGTERIPTEIKESAHKIWLAGLGALTAAEEEGSKLFKNLVEKGKTYESKGREVVSDAKDDIDGAVDEARVKAEKAWDKVEETSDEWMGATLRRFGVPTRDEIATLTLRVEELTRVVEKMNESPKKTSTRSAAGKAKSTTKRTAKTAPKTTAKAATAKAATTKAATTKAATTKAATTKAAAAKPATTSGSSDATN